MKKMENEKIAVKSIDLCQKTGKCQINFKNKHNSQGKMLEKL